MSAFEVDWDEGTEARYEAVSERMWAVDDESDEEAYELDDPKHPTYHERYAKLGDPEE